jgi:MFS family permease
MGPGFRRGDGSMKSTQQSCSKAYRGWVLFLLLLTYMSSYIDRSILGILAEPIKNELGLSDGQLGLLSGLSFALFYTLLGIPIARLAERYSRSMIISISLIVWSGMTALCGVTASYAQLLLCRIGVGVGEAGGNPASHSLITDIFPAERRASALAIYSLGVPLGSLIGAVAGGAMTQLWGWRTAFLVVGPPGILLALLVMFTIREPARGQSDALKVSDEVPPLSAVLRLLFGERVFVHLAAGAALVVLAGYSVALFMAPFFLRQFGLPIREVGLISGVVNGFAAGAGIVIGGFITDLAGKRDPRFYAWLPAVCVAMAGPLFARAFLQTAWLPAMLLLIPATTLIYTYFAPTFAVMHNMVEPRMRATAAAVLFLIINLVGMGLGPPIVGAASDLFAARLGSAAEGMRYALVGCGLVCLWAAVHFALAGAWLKRR